MLRLQLGIKELFYVRFHWAILAKFWQLTYSFLSLDSSGPWQVYDAEDNEPNNQRHTHG